MNLLFRSLLAGLPAAILMSAVFLVISCGHFIFKFLFDFSSNKVLRSMMEEKILGTPLFWDLVGFGCAQLALHAGLAVFIWLLAHATEKAVPASLGRRRELVLGWFLLYGAWVLTANAAYYPHSLAGVAYKPLVVDLVGTVSTVDVYTVLLFIATLAVVSGALWNIQNRSKPLRIGAIAALFSLVGCAVWQSQSSQAKNAADAINEQPNVIFIGIDSLRRDMVGRERSRNLTPNIDQFLDGAHSFSDAITPLARTFPSWTAILTGRHPVKTGARFNLTPRVDVRTMPTLADRLRAMGYRTVYSTDEVRFANIDESFGFDELITPKIGASDFVLGTVNDLPLPNLLSSTTVAKLLFPNTYTNRAAAITYRPDAFIERFDSGLKSDKPLFLAIHFTLPHWPYTWADDHNDDHVPSNVEGRFRYEYSAAVIKADQQFGAFWQRLEAQGILKNAIVVLLSDHGEALHLPVDNAVEQATENNPDRVEVWSRGHGTSVLSPPQYNVVLALRAFGKVNFPAAPLPRQPPVVTDLPVSLEDLTPTILELLGKPATPTEFDGVSIAPLLTGHAETQTTQLRDRLRFTETDFNTPLVLEGKIDKDGLINEAGIFYRLNAENGRVELRHDKWPELLAQKERAVMKGPWMLAALPTPERTGTRYVFLNRNKGAPKMITAVPDGASDPEVSELWRALQEKFPGELHPPAAAERKVAARGTSR